MATKDIARIEAALGHHVPHYYREFILANGDELDVLRVREVGTIHTDADEVINDNLFSRRAPECFVIGEDDEPWPANYFIVGNNGGGDYWFVHRDAWDLGLWFYSCEAHEIRRRHSLLTDYLDRLREELQSQNRVRFTEFTEE